MNPIEEKGVIAWFARNPVAANLLLLCVIITGFISSGMLRKESFPSMEPSNVTVSVVYNSGDPKQAEEGIAIKIEDALQGVPGIKRITSSSTASVATITIEKTSEQDLEELLDDVKNKVDSINNFPSGAEKAVVEKATMKDHAIWVQLYGDADRKVMQDLIEELKIDLLQKDGISDISITGEADPYISIEVDESALQSYGISLTDIDEAINSESEVALSTSLRNSEKTVRLKVSDQVYALDEFAKIPIVSTETGAQVLLGDIAKIENSFDEDTFVMSRYNRQPGMAAQIMMDENGDVTKISEQANDVVQDWKSRGILPDNVHIKTWYDKSTMIKERLSLLISNAVTGIALVFVILAIFLNVSVATWVAAGLPFIFAGTMLVMYQLGLTINEMTTFGFIMALGIVVDDAVVIGESVYSERRTHGDSLSNTIRGTLKVAMPTIFGVLTTVATFLALSNIEGGLGKIFAQFGTVVTICLLLSMIESKWILPSHLAHLNTKKSEKRGPWAKVQHAADAGLTWVNKKLYVPMIEVCLNFRYAVILIFISIFIFIANMSSMGMVKVAFFPNIKQEIVNASIDMHEDASFGVTHKNMMALENSAYKADAELMKKYGEVGSGIESLQITASNDTSGKSVAEFTENAPYSSQEFATTWSKHLGSLEAAKKVKVMASMDMVDNFNLQLKASDSETITAAGNEVKAYLESLDGVSSIEDNLNPSIPQYKLELNDYGRTLGLTTSDLSRQVLENFGGGSVQKFQQNSLEVTVSVRYPKEKRQTLDNILNANIRTNDGLTIPLSEIAKVTSDYQQSTIKRIDNLRAVEISAVVNKDKTSPEQLVAQVQENVLPGIQAKYPTLKYKFAGEAEQKAETMDSMMLMAVAAFLAIYALLAIPLKSYVQPVLIMTAIPFGIVGAIFGHWLTGLTLSILSMFGILALSGVVVNDSLLLVSRYNELRDQGTPMHEAVVESCSGRLRAVLLTSFTTFGGLIPLLSEDSMQAEFLKPAAASLGYGIMFATLITLLLIPSLLYIQEDVKKVMLKIKCIAIKQ